MLAALVTAVVLAVGKQLPAAVGVLLGGVLQAYVIVVVARICAAFARGPKV